MRVSELEGKKVVIWGTGKEGVAAAAFIGAHLPAQELVFIDEGAGPSVLSSGARSFDVVRQPEALERILAVADVVVKSPGVSLYHPMLEKEKARGLVITSLLNLWIEARGTGHVIGVTGTKGKSTTSSLLHHVLTRLGKKSVLLGNIGTPVTEYEGDADYFVVEVSSYQAANFSGMCDVGILVSLYPEHLDWHRSLTAYYKDKANLLVHSRLKLVEPTARALLGDLGVDLKGTLEFNQPDGFHFFGEAVYNGAVLQGELDNAYLLRKHNRSNVCCVLEAVHALGLDAQAALASMGDFKGLPHRQFELGEKDGVLYVDDSISTTPQSAIAAMEVYKGRPIALIAGGFDRAIDYAPLVQYAAERGVSVVCLGDSGKRIFELLKAKGAKDFCLCSTMSEAVREARARVAAGGVILLSPAAPSYGMFKDFIERAACFSKECGF